MARKLKYVESICLEKPIKKKHETKHSQTNCLDSDGVSWKNGESWDKDTCTECNCLVWLFLGVFTWQYLFDLLLLNREDLFDARHCNAPFARIPVKWKVNVVRYATSSDDDRLFFLCPEGSLVWLAFLTWNTFCFVCFILYTKREKNVCDVPVIFYLKKNSRKSKRNFTVWCNDEREFIVFIAKSLLVFQLTFHANSSKSLFCRLILI